MLAIQSSQVMGGTYVIPDRRDDTEFIRAVPRYIQPAAPWRIVISIDIMEMRRVPSIFGVAVGVRPGGDRAEIPRSRRVIEDPLHIHFRSGSDEVLGEVCYCHVT